MCCVLLSFVDLCVVSLFSLCLLLCHCRKSGVLYVLCCGGLLSYKCRTLLYWHITDIVLIVSGTVSRIQKSEKSGLQFHCLLSSNTVDGVASKGILAGLYSMGINKRRDDGYSLCHAVGRRYWTSWKQVFLFKQGYGQRERFEA